MRSIVAGLFISLDGVVESPDMWGFRYMDAEMSKGISAGVGQADTVLLGRRTYLEFSKLWPDQGDEVPMAKFLNQSPKYVVSSTLDHLEWGPASLVKGDLSKALTELKQKPGKNIQVPGSPTLVRSLLRFGLLDMLSLSICPVVVGNGMRLFDQSMPMVDMTLVHSTVLSTGVIGATYIPVRDSSSVQKSINFPQAAVGNSPGAL